MGSNFLSYGERILDSREERKTMQIKVHKTYKAGTIIISIKTSATNNGVTKRRIRSSTCRISTGTNGL